MDDCSAQLHELRLEGPAVGHVEASECRISDVGDGGSTDLVSHSSTDDLHVNTAQCTRFSPTSASTKVFGTPELLALVLAYLDPTTIFALRRTNNTFARTILESPGLRLRPFLSPQWLHPPAHFALLDPKIPGLSIQRGDAVEKGRWITITLDAAAAKAIVPPDRRIWQANRASTSGVLGQGLGSTSQRTGDTCPADRPRGPLVKYENVHLTQPPLLGCQAFMVYTSKVKTPANVPSSSNGDGPDYTTRISETAFAKLSCDAGISLEFVANSALTFLAGRTDGLKVMFKAIMSFGEPAQLLRKRNTKRWVTCVHRMD